jgi:hypothetical protein
MTAEKWVVPDPIQYELLSLRQVANNEESPFLGIHLDPMFDCLQTKFLCCHSIGNINGMAGMLTLMNSFITETTCTTKLSYVYLNKNSEFEEQFSGTLKQHYTSMGKCAKIVI